MSVQRESSLLASSLLSRALLASERLGSKGAHGVRALLAVDHDGEAFVVVQLGASVAGGLLGGGGGGIPLGLEALSLPGLGDHATLGAALDVEHELGEGEPAEGVEHTGHVGAVNEDGPVVGPVDDHDELAVVLAKVNISNSARLHVSSNGLKESQLAHFAKIRRPLVRCQPAVQGG